MAIPRGRFGNRLDTAAGRAKEAQMEAAAAAQAAQAAMRVAQAEAAAGRAAEAARAAQAAQAAAQRAAPVVQQAVAAHTQQLATGASGAPPVPQLAAPAPAAAPAAAAPSSSFTPVTTPAGGREVSLDYARQVEQRVNDLLAQGNIDGALAQARNITGGGPGVQNALNRINAAISAASDFRSRAQGGGPTDTDTDTDTGPGNSSGMSDAEKKRLTDLEDQLQALLDGQSRRDQQDRDNASAFLSGILRQYGMDSLAGQVDSLVRQWGTSTEVIAEKLRQTDEYKERFKGLLGLQQRGITDVRNEAQYLQLESGYREVFRQAGIQSFLGDAGSAAERDSIADIVGKFSLSVDEVRARVDDAQRVVAESPPEVREALQRFYNVPANELVAYTLDPERTMNRINRMANAAIVGGSAAQRGLDIDLTTAELTADLAGDQDINPAQVSADMTRSRMLRDTTRRLAEIEKSTLTDSEVVQSQLNLSADAQQRVRGLQSRERARFSGSSGITSAALNRTRGM